MPRIRHSASARPRARLISTPNTTYGDLMPTSTVHGIRFSDALASLLEHAEAHGFRVEPDTRGKGKPSGLVVYPADKAHSMITVNERGAKFNRAHYENLRRQLYAAGLPPLPADAPATAASEEHVVDDRIFGSAEAAAAAAAAAGGNARVLDLGAALDGEADLSEYLGENNEHAPAFMANIIGSLSLAIGQSPETGSLVAGLVDVAMRWSADNTGAELDRRIADASAQVSARFSKELEEALAMASKQEATALRAQKALEAAEARETKAREDCRAALRRAEAAEAKAAEAEAVLAPLRALLAGGK